MAALKERWDSRRIVKVDGPGTASIRVYCLYFGDKGDFALGANGWTATGMPVMGAALVLSGFSVTEYDTPICAYVEQTPRWSRKRGFVRVLYEGVGTWQD